nr:hypothetical protein [Tanacetum cinerariifolium]
MMLLALTITQHFLTLTNNCLHTSSNIRNQAIIQDGRVDIQSKNVGYARNGSRNAGRIAGNQGTNARNGFAQTNAAIGKNVQRNPKTTTNIGKTTVQCYKCNEKDHFARDCPKSKVSNSNEPNVNASRAKRASRNHDHLALVANSYASPLYSGSS